MECVFPSHGLWMPIHVCFFHSNSCSFCVCRPEKQNAERTMHVWCRLTDRIWFLTQREWSARSAMWSLSLARESCSESVSTASASEEDRECPAVAYTVHTLTFIVLYCHAVVKRTLCVSVGRECLRSVILMSEDPQVACPYRDEAYACDCILQEREIRAVRTHSFILLLFCLQKDCLVFTHGWEVSVAVCRSLTLWMWPCPWCWSAVDRRPGAMLLWKAFNDRTIG